MNQGIVQSSLVQVQQIGIPNWWSINNNMQPPPHHQHHSLLAALPHNHIPHHLTPPLIVPPSWTESQDLPESWSQQVLGLVGEDKRGISHMQPKNLENWEQQLLNHTSNSSGDVMQENSVASYTYGPGNVEFQAAKSTNCLSPQIMASASPSKSCITTSTMRRDKFSFSNKSSECNSTASGGAAKKARIQTSSTQSGMKVRKEKLGDRITALHQLVSPFGKTDTASVLLEALGYIRFLQRQIEALSLPYLGSGSGNMRRQQPVKREMSCPEDPGQLLNENHINRKAISEQECGEEAKKDLKSRGLCLVPISCTVDVGSENGADYWAPAFGGNFQ